MRSLVLAATSCLFSFEVSAACPAGLRPFTEFNMFFGMSHVDGRAVSDDQWREFVADSVTPRFRAGFTVVDARGQWTKPDGVLEREPVKLVIGAVEADANRGMEQVRGLSEEFVRRFGQEPPFTISKEACGGPASR